MNERELLYTIGQYMVCSNDKLDAKMDTIRAWFEEFCRKNKMERESAQDQLLYDIYHKAVFFETDEEAIDEKAFSRFMKENLSKGVNAEKALDGLEQYMICEDTANPKTMEKARMLFETVCKVFEINGSVEQDNILHSLYFRAALEEVINEGEFLRFMKRNLVPQDVRKLAYNVQDELFSFINEVNASGATCMKKEIETDNHELLFHDEETWEKAVAFFDMLGLDFTTGEPDGDNAWYVNFEFSDGVVSRS